MFVCCCVTFLTSFNNNRNVCLFADLTLLIIVVIMHTRVARRAYNYNRFYLFIYCVNETSLHRNWYTYIARDAQVYLCQLPAVCKPTKPHHRIINQFFFCSMRRQNEENKEEEKQMNKHKMYRFECCIYILYICLRCTYVNIVHCRLYKCTLYKYMLWRKC